MIRYENECVGCPQGCKHCSLERVICYYCCDKCDEEAELYEFDGEQLCESCLLETVPKVEV